jgi:hypothetical protein
MTCHLGPLSTHPGEQQSYPTVKIGDWAGKLRERALVRDEASALAE